MNKIKIIFLLTQLVVFSISAVAQKVNVKKQFKNAAAQTSYMLATIDSLKAGGLPAELVAPRTSEKNKLKMVRGTDWTSGFFSGGLWFLYEQTGNKQWLAAAKKFTELLTPVQYFAGTHDLGFMMYCSFGNGYRLTGDTAYRSIIIQSAKTLSTRFSPVTGVIKSWDFASDHKWKYPVIIDNMMNLELLFVATKLTGDSVFYKVAIAHANTTLKNHFRPDHSSYHVVDYDTISGAVRSKTTHQGYADESAWARGQAWGSPLSTGL
jgi:rhamnogalacturonyl hydrolase YesR